MALIHFLLVLFPLLFADENFNAPSAPPTLAPWVDTVHLVMSNHLDVGFDGIKGEGFAVNVVNTYFDEYFPNAVKWGSNITSTTNLTYAWMTQSWLISMYFDCPSGMGLHCPSQEQMNNIKNGINEGYIFWHGFPFNSQQEMYDISMLEFGLRLSRDLSATYNAPVSHIISQRDVPGMTRSMIPILNQNNITAVSIGVNGGSAPPAVPHIFRWKDVVSGEEIFGLWNPGGYGGENYPDPVYMSDFNEALVYAWRGDNQGPPPPEQVIEFFETAQREFPNAKVIASSITNFTDNLMNNLPAVNNLPQYDYEIGDTWIHGVQSDPWKTSIHRIAQRQRATCLATGKCNYDSVAFYNFSRLLLKNGEHTWGGDIKKFLGYGKNGSDYYAWSNEQLNAALLANNGSNPMTTFRSTWYEQRNWGCYYAMEALSMSTESGDKQLYNNIMNEWNIVSNVKSPLDTGDWTKVTDPSQTFQVTSSYDGNKYEIQFDVDTGSILKLTNMNTNKNYADDTHLLSQFIYATYTEDDFNEYLLEYAYSQPPAGYMPGDFGKSGLDKAAHPKHQYLTANFTALYKMNDSDGVFMVAMNFGTLQNNLHTMYGAPDMIYNIIDFSSKASTFSSDIIWINKTGTRMPEDYFYRFNPLNCNDWKVSKFNEMVDISNIVLNGSMHMMATTGNVSCDIGNSNFKIEPVDVALATFVPISVNEYSPFPVPFYNSSEITGTAFVLYDNTWGTNYPVWWPYDPADANNTYRFNVYI